MTKDGDSKQNILYRRRVITIEDVIINWLNENYDNKKFTFRKLNNCLIGIFRKDSLELIKVVNEYSIKQKLKKEKYWK